MALTLEIRLNLLPQVAGRVAPACSAIVGKAVFDAFAGAQVDVPVDTGALKNSGQVAFSPGAMSGEISYGTDHAVYVHEGTYKMAARPWLKNAIEAAQPSFLAALAELEARLG